MFYRRASYAGAMSVSDQVPEAPYERLLELVDRLACDRDVVIGHDVERTLEQLVIEALADGSVDRELHLPDVVRWLTALAHGYRAIRVDHPEVERDTELALLRLLITRWLHPARRDA